MMATCDAEITHDVLDRLCPLYVMLDDTGTILCCGRTMQRLWPEDVASKSPFDAIFRVEKPHDYKSIGDLTQHRPPGLRIALKHGSRVEFRGQAMRLAPDRILIDLSFGLSLHEAVREYDLRAADFAPTDLAVELLYLLEAKTAALCEFEQLNQRLRSAKALAEEQATSDPLTGLRNRRALDQALQQLLSRRQAFGLLHIDLDHFKTVNDTHGHAAGDQMLVEVARRLRVATRDNDLVARVGGDEFIVLAKGLTGRDGLREMASRILDILSHPLPVTDLGQMVSASIGIARNQPGRGLTADRLLAEADRALYRSKSLGRGRACFDDHVEEPAAPAVTPL